MILRKPGDTLVRLRLDLPREFSVIMDIPEKVRADKEFKAQVAEICGPDAIEKISG